MCYNFTYFIVHSSAFSHQLTICRGKKSINNWLNSIKTLVVSFAVLRSVVLVSRRRQQHVFTLVSRSHSNRHTHARCQPVWTFSTPIPANIWVQYSSRAYPTHTHALCIVTAAVLAVHFVANAFALTCIPFSPLHIITIKSTLWCDSRTHFRITFFFFFWIENAGVGWQCHHYQKQHIHALPVRQLSYFVDEPF